MEGGGTLTARQRDVLALLEKGLTNGEIARVLGVSISTVKVHVEHVLRALNVTNRTEAAALASQVLRQDAAGACAALAKRPAVAVLRFDAEPDDPLARTFAAGLADDIITRLCKWRWFPVIARSTSFYYGSDRPASEIQRLTGAVYLLGGSVAHHDGRLRVSVRLDDARHEWCLWSDRFDLSVGDVFALQDEIATVVVGRAYPEILQAEGRLARNAPPGELSAWQLAHDGLLHVDSGRKTDNEQALELFDRASQQDPTFVLPVYGKGMGLFEQIFNQWTDRIAESSAELERCADRAIEIDANDAAGWVLAGRCALMVGDPRRAIEPLERATALNPCNDRAQAWLGLAYVGEGDRAGFANLKLAARLSPRTNLGSLGLAHFAVGEYEQAVAACREALTYTTYVMINAVLCASLALAGDAAAARAEIARLREREPGYTLAGWHQMVPPGRHDITDRIAEGLRRAGLER